jgi:hypothetical protein
VHKRIISAVKRVEFVSDRISYIILSGPWCHIIVLNVHTLTEDKTGDVKDSFYEELERVFDKFPKLHSIHIQNFSSVTQIFICFGLIIVYVGHDFNHHMLISFSH